MSRGVVGRWLASPPHTTAMAANSASATIFRCVWAFAFWIDQFMATLLVHLFSWLNVAA